METFGTHNRYELCPPGEPSGSWNWDTGFPGKGIAGHGTIGPKTIPATTQRVPIVAVWGPWATDRMSLWCVTMKQPAVQAGIVAPTIATPPFSIELEMRCGAELIPGPVLPVRVWTVATALELAAPQFVLQVSGRLVNEWELWARVFLAEGQGGTAGSVSVQLRMLLDRQGGSSCCSADKDGNRLVWDLGPNIA